MIAALPMYDWPEERPAVDALWGRLRDRMRAAGVDAPDSLTRGPEVDTLWLAPDLLLGQTCAHPLATRLAGRVSYVASPTYDVEGCGPGLYSSVVVMRRRENEADVAAPEDGRPRLPALGGLRLAFNGTDSLSGHVGLRRDLVASGAAIPEDAVETGAHRMSIVAVASGDADCAAIDCVSWAMARRHEAAAKEVHVVGWTARRPALPFITRRDCPNDLLDLLRAAVAAECGAVVLDPPVDVA